VEAARARLLLDCGPGVLAALGDPSLSAGATSRGLGFDAILISHAHPDHWLDLVMWRQGLLYGPEARDSAVLRVLAGKQTIDKISAVTAALVDGAGFFEPVMELEVLDEDTVYDVGGAKISFCRTRHTEPCWASRIEADGNVLVYTADSGPIAELTQFAADADLLIAECTLPDRAGNEDAMWHLSPKEAGEMGARARARQLVLTHYFAELDTESMRRQASTAFGSAVALAREGEWYACE
jgi:ribonuclease BN (tRNA processing enzyme)